MSTVDSNAFNVTLSGGGGGTPAYIAALAPFDALQLPTSQNGDGTVFDTLNNPANGAQEWLTSDPGDTDPNYAQVIGAWSGGAGDGDIRTMWAHGGGHADSANNGVYRFDFSGDPWTGATIDHIAAVADVIDQSNYADGSPGAIHTYQGVWAYSGSMYRMPGSRYRSAGASDFGDCWRNTNGTWTKMALYPAQNFAIAITAVNKTKGKTFIANRGYGQVEFYNIAANTFKQLGYSGTRPSESNGSYHSAACNEITGEVLIVGNGWFARFMPDWDAETIAGSAIEPVSISGYGGATAPLLVWDPTLEDYWAFGGHGAANWSTVYRISGTGASKTATAHSLSQTVTEDTGVALFNRGFIMDQDRALGLVASHNQNPWVIRLPSS